MPQGSVEALVVDVSAAFSLIKCTSAIVSFLVVRQSSQWAPLLLFPKDRFY